MSFFVKSKSNANNKHANKRKRKIVKPQDDDLTSGSENEASKKEIDNESSEDENETAQEKRVRLAKVYLEEISKQEKQRIDEVDDDVISKRLRSDYLKQAGKLRLVVADKYTGADLDNIKILKCKENKNTITSVCVTSDDKYIFSGNKDGTIVKWSIDDGKKIVSLPFTKKKSHPKSTEGHCKPIMSLNISSDGKFLAAGDETKDIQIWNPENLQHVNTLSGHRNSVTGLVFRKDTHTLYSCSKDRSVKVWSLDDMAYVETLYGHQDMVTSIDVLYRERAVTSGGRDTTIRIWKIAEESQLIYNAPSGSVDVVRLINEDNFISGGIDGSLCIWGVNKKKPLCVVKEAHGCDPTNSQPFWICSVASLLNTDLIASGSQDGSIKIWKLGESFRTIVNLFNIPTLGFVNSLCFTADGKYLIAGVGREHKFGRWNVLKSAKNTILIIPLLQRS